MISTGDDSPGLVANGVFGDLAANVGNINAAGRYSQGVVAASSFAGVVEVAIARGAVVEGGWQQDITSFSIRTGLPSAGVVIGGGLLALFAHQQRDDRRTVGPRHHIGRPFHARAEHPAAVSGRHLFAGRRRPQSHQQRPGRRLHQVRQRRVRLRQFWHFRCAPFRRQQWRRHPQCRAGGGFGLWRQRRHAVHQCWRLARRDRHAARAVSTRRASMSRPAWPAATRPPSTTPAFPASSRRSSSICRPSSIPASSPCRTVKPAAAARLPATCW